MLQLCGMPCKNSVFSNDSSGSPELFLPFQCVGVSSKCKESTVTLACIRNLGLGEAVREETLPSFHGNNIVPRLLFPMEYWDLGGNIVPVLIMATGLEL